MRSCAFMFSDNVLGISHINSTGSQVNSSPRWPLADDAIETFCGAGWHALFTLTIYTPTDNQGKGACERLGEGEWNIKKGLRQLSHAPQHTHTHTPIK